MLFLLSFSSPPTCYFPSFFLRSWEASAEKRLTLSRLLYDPKGGDRMPFFGTIFTIIIVYLLFLSRCGDKSGESESLHNALTK
jgi:hypothetical protein